MSERLGCRDCGATVPGPKFRYYACNQLIGLAEDDPDLLRVIAGNLRALSAEVEDHRAG